MGKILIVWGHVIRGWLYIVTGGLAIGLAEGWSKISPGQTEAVYLFGTSWIGKVILVLIVIGLTGYALWGAVRLKHAHNFLDRIGFFSSMVWYLALAAPAAILLTTGKYNMTGKTRITGILQANLMGKLTVIIIGIILAGAGIFQVITAVRGEGIPEEIGEHLSKIARVGIAARGILIGLGGVFLITSGQTGTAQTLLIIYRWRYGGYLVGILGAGLIALGMYSFAKIKYLKWPHENTNYI